jgi:hypothetical protein
MKSLICTTIGAVFLTASTGVAITEYDQDVTPDAIFGSGNANGSFTTNRDNGVELGLRTKLRFGPANIFSSNGDGSYTWNTGSGTSSPPNPEWGFEWSVNSDWDGSSGWKIDDLTYELGIDFDPGNATNYLVFDPISLGGFIPFNPPAGPVTYWDHSIGDNSTGNGAGAEAPSGDTAAYEALIAANNVAQNSWRMTFFDDFPFTFDPDVPGRYSFYLAAFRDGEEVARVEIDAIVVDGVGLTLEADACQPDQDAAAGTQIAVELWLRNPDDDDVTGYQAFLAFDESELTYVGAASSYTLLPFETHVQDIGSANVATNEIRVDGSTMTTVTGDAKLATLIFTVDVECDGKEIDFDLTQPFDSEVSFAGMPLATDLVNSGPIVGDDTPPVITCPADVTVSCPEDADPGVVLGVASGGVAIHYNDNGGGEVPTNQAYLKAQFSATEPTVGAPFVFDDTPLTGVPLFSWYSLFSGLVWPESQYGLDLVLETPFSDGSNPTPTLDAYDNGNNDVSGRILVGPVSWAINDYKPHTPDITAGDVLNSIFRSTSPGTAGDITITRNDVSLSGTVYTAVVEGFLVSDGIIHWYTVGTPDTAMSQFLLNGTFYFSGTLTYDILTDSDPLMDFYMGPVMLTANFPSAATGTATATDNCTLFPVISYSDSDNGGSGCPGDPLIITRTWTATDDCGNTDTCVQTITVVDTTDPTFLSVPDDLEANADAGGCTKTFTASEIGMPTATDDCTPFPGVPVTFVRSDGAPNIDDPYDAADSPIEITWTATDACGNTSDYVQTITVNAVNDLAIDIQLGGVLTIPTRCIHFVLDDCTEFNVELDFDDGPGLFSGIVEIPCGSWTTLCIKDEQHTQWDTSTLSDIGTSYTGTAATLLAGDTDNDGDVDINDVTFYIATFGDLAALGGCPWDGVTRDADFSNNGAVGAEDYTLLTGQWLTLSTCGCILPAQGLASANGRPGGPQP